MSSAACPECDVELEYGGDLQAKLRRAGLVFRIGLIALIVLLALRAVTPVGRVPFDLMIGVSVVLVVIGIFMSATKPDKIKIVRSERRD